MSRLFCCFGVVFVLAIAGLHISGLGHYTDQVRDSNLSPFIKDMFVILYVVPSLYLCVLGVFGVLAFFNPQLRKPVCLVLAVSVFATGLLALVLGEWVPVIVMSVGAVFFLISALMTRTTA